MPARQIPVFSQLAVIPLLHDEFSRYSHDIIQRPTFRTLTDCPQHSCQFLYCLANSRVISPSQHSMTNVSHTDRLSTALLSIPLLPGEFSCYFAITAFHDCRQAYGQSIHSCLPFACLLRDSHVTRRGISTNKTSEFYACRT
jgi:hypothetical protein